MRIFLDDDRNHPVGEDWIVVRTVEDMLDLIDRHDAEIEEISFDNDLRQQFDGIHGLNAIRERLLDDPRRLRGLKRITVHSLNGEAARAMLSDITSYVKHGLLPDIEIRRRPAEGSFYPLHENDPRGILAHARRTASASDEILRKENEMFPRFDPEEMSRQVAEAIARRQQAEREYDAAVVKPEEIGTRKGIVHAASILVWARLAEMAGIPCIPVETIASVPMSAVEKIMDSKEDQLDEQEREALSRADIYCNDGGFWRTEICAPQDVKSAMGHNMPLPDVMPFVLDDPRLLDMHYNMPDVKVVARPRLTPVRHAGWPVEFRTFFGGQAVDGAASWYYPQAGRFETTPELEAAMDQAVAWGHRLHDLRAELSLVPALPESHRAGPEIGSTIDFMLTEEQGLVLVDAGPGFGFGAHPCCFIDVPVEGRRWNLPDGVDLR